MDWTGSLSHLLQNKYVKTSNKLNLSSQFVHTKCSWQANSVREKRQSGTGETKAVIVWTVFHHEKQSQKEKAQSGRVEEQKRTGALLILPMTTLDSYPAQTALAVWRTLTLSVQDLWKNEVTIYVRCLFLAWTSSNRRHNFL